MPQSAAADGGICILPLMNITRGQRIGLGIVGMFYGHAVAAVLLGVAIVLRNVRDIGFVVHHWPFMAAQILASVALEACVAGLTWLLFVAPALAWVTPQRLRDFGAWLYGFVIVVAALSIGVMWLALFVELRRSHIPVRPHIPAITAGVTFVYTAVVCGVSLWRYFVLAGNAETLLEAKRRLR